MSSGNGGYDQREFDEQLTRIAKQAMAWGADLNRLPAMIRGRVERLLEQQAATHVPSKVIPTG